MPVCCVPVCDSKGNTPIYIKRKLSLSCRPKIPLTSTTRNLAEKLEDTVVSPESLSLSGDEEKVAVNGSETLMKRSSTDETLETLIYDEFFMQEITRVLDKKWRIAQQLRTDSSRTIDQLLGLQDSITSSQHSSHINFASPHHYSHNQDNHAISTNILPTNSHNGNNRLTISPDCPQDLPQKQHNHYSSTSNLPLPPPPPILRCISSKSATLRPLSSSGKPAPPPPPRRSDSTRLSCRSQIRRGTKNCC